MQAAIYGIEALALTDEERSFFRDAEPAGYILFQPQLREPGPIVAAD